MPVWVIMPAMMPAVAQARATPSTERAPPSSAWMYCRGRMKVPFFTVSFTLRPLPAAMAASTMVFK